MTAALHSVPSYSPAESLEIHQESDAYDIAQYAKVQAKAIGFSAFEAGLFSAAVSEITMNVVRYGVHGIAVIQVTDNGKGIQAHIDDRGPGIANIELAMQDGYSTKNSLGLGMGAIKRSVDDMDVRTGSNGTSISIAKYLPLPREDIDVGMVSFPIVGEQLNGDAYFIKGYHGDTLIAAVLDGAGHGPKAAKSAQLIEALWKQNYKSPLIELLNRGDELLQGSDTTRGVEATLIRITPTDIEAITMGNLMLHTGLNSDNSVSPQNGSLGLSLPTDIHLHQFKRPDNFCFILHSDGLTNVDYATSDDYSAQKQAELLFDGYAVTDDDATVMVLKG